MSEAQEAIVKIGTGLDIGGHKAKVVAISKDGVKCKIEGEKHEHTIDFAMIEKYCL